MSALYWNLKVIKARYLTGRVERQTHRILFPPVRFGEHVLFGGRWRESVLVRLLGMHYRSSYRRDYWWYSVEAPHFFNQRIGFFQFACGHDLLGPHFFYRGMFNSELVRRGDIVLDIGCGDGFFSKRFLSVRARHVDAIDIEPSAIAAAKRHNQGASIVYRRQAAVSEDFPNNAPGAYDLIVWDGALGHFPVESTMLMLAKIEKALRPGGIFAGSESLGSGEGPEDLAAVFRPFLGTFICKLSITICRRADSSAARRTGAAPMPIVV